MQATAITTALAMTRRNDLLVDAADRRRAAAVTPRRERPASDVTIRLARRDDARELGRLAQLDGAPAAEEAGWGHALAAGQVLVAESNGALIAARTVRYGAAIADPFHPAREARALLELRARQLTGTSRRQRVIRPRLSGLGLRVGGAR